MFWLSQWILKKQDARFLQSLIDTKAQVDEVTDRQVRMQLLQMRLRRAVDPYLYIFKLTWEIVRGRYWKSGSKSDGSADPAPGGSPGTVGVSAAQFAFNAGFTTSPQPPYAQPPANSGIASVSTPVFEDAGIIAGEVVAYRCWTLKPDGLLYSVYQSGFCWVPGEVVEGNAADGDGVHAFKSLLLMAEYGMKRSGYPIVTGTVDLWGDVYEHERGYRASKAAIRSIDSSPDYDAKALRRLYGLNKSKKPLPKPEA